MRNLALLAILTLSALALAGCSGDGDGDGDPTSSSSSSSRSSSATSTSRSSTSGSASGTSTSSAPNQPPTGTLSSAVNGTTASLSLAGSDPDGDILVWDLDFGDGARTNGTALPATVNHTYAVGNYTVTFTLTDGKDPQSYNVSIAVAGSTAGGQENYEFTGTITGSWNPGTGYTGEPVDHTFEVTQPGLTMTAHLAPGPTAVDLDYALIDPSGETAASAAAIFPVDSADPEPDLVVADAEPGTWIVRIQAGNSVEGEYTVTVSFE